MKRVYTKKSIVAKDAVTTFEFAFYVGVSCSSVLKWIQNGKIFAYKSDVINGFGTFNNLIPIRELKRMDKQLKKIARQKEKLKCTK